MKRTPSRKPPRRRSTASAGWASLEQRIARDLGKARRKKANASGVDKRFTIHLANLKIDVLAWLLKTLRAEKKAKPNVRISDGANVDKP